MRILGRIVGVRSTEQSAGIIIGDFAPTAFFSIAYLIFLQIQIVAFSITVYNMIQCQKINRQRKDKSMQRTKQNHAWRVFRLLLIFSVSVCLYSLLPAAKAG